MRNCFLIIVMLILVGFSAASAHADLNNFLYGLNDQAKADMNGFHVGLSAQFGVPLPQVRSIIKGVEFPADAFMCLQLSQMTKIDPDRVLRIYKSNRKKGWGAVAKELGIKPGSAEFHALKRGDLSFAGMSDGKTKAHGKTKVKDKNKNKGKGKGHSK